MKKKEHAKPHIEENSEGWLISFADLMTNLTCFFLLLTIFANYEKPGSGAVAKEIADNINKENKTKDPQTKLQELGAEISKNKVMAKNVKVAMKNAELQITFSSNVLFKEKSVDISEDIAPTLQGLIDIIRAKDVNFRVLIEGHSDPYEFREIETVKSTWELGAIRASRILGEFENYGFDPNKLIAVSKGDTEPVEPNKNEEGTPIPENMALNRRVVIKVLEPMHSNEKIKFGLGLYFNEKLND